MRPWKGLVVFFSVLACGDGNPQPVPVRCERLSVLERLGSGCPPDRAEGDSAGEGLGDDRPTAAEIVGICARGKDRVALPPGARLCSAIWFDGRCRSEEDSRTLTLQPPYQGDCYRVQELQGLVALVAEDSAGTPDPGGVGAAMDPALLLDRRPTAPYLALLAVDRSLLEFVRPWPLRIEQQSISASGACITATLTDSDPPGDECRIGGTLMFAPVGAQADPGGGPADTVASGPSAAAAADGGAPVDAQSGGGA